ncbi:MAG: 2-oxoglutarate dehydrogenase E1 component [Myxococcota bacterium]|nr:2-oxoglutarate dehydrogenase E1 component [Myxococcota bacterium]
MKAPSILSLDFVEALWTKYARDPSTVPTEWRAYFESLQSDPLTRAEDSHTMAIGHRQLVDEPRPDAEQCTTCGRVFAMSELQRRVGELIRAYRVRGHRAAHLDPLETTPPELDELDARHFGFVAADLDLKFSPGTLSSGEQLTLGEIISRLRQTYCSAIGVQFMHIGNRSKREWLQRTMEASLNTIQLSRDQQIRILRRLTDAIVFEKFVQRKFVGAKSFSLEGAESLIPLLDMVIEQAAHHGIEQIIIGMPHRGRLNVLANILGKHPRKIFSEFQDALPANGDAASDVKYHLGYHRDMVHPNGVKMHVDLMFNPSHLEFVSPVAQGALRAEQDNMGDLDRERSLLILIHGDASFVGQGIVQETLNLSNLAAYRVGGTLHIVVNNQIGFTTPPGQGRSSQYATDVARMLPIPVFHINGEHPEAVAQAVHLGVDFRQRFQSDVVIDMYCYRRRGHNESDDPTFTQPLMYKKIAQRPTVQESYTQHLLSLGGLTRDEADEIQQDQLAHLESEFKNTDARDSEQFPARPNAFEPKWDKYHGTTGSEVAGAVDTGVAEDVLQSLLDRLTTIPPGLKAHKKIIKILATRKSMATGDHLVDWGTAEALALASLATEGVRIRLCGQDTQRGTFSHRHAVLHDVETGAAHMPLAHLSPDQAPVEIVNSPLSEGAALGFEYGYSTVTPDALVIWEAQFGDFSNAAQVYIDQFISTGQSKWQLLSGLTLFLPHGLEGTGPEHASARLERFLSLAADGNYRVASPTTPAQLFHLLRRQIVAPARLPLAVMTPKSMLRLSTSFSALGALASGRFLDIIEDGDVPLATASRVLLCTGKIYYDLINYRTLNRQDDVAIVRIEQLHPLAYKHLKNTLQALPQGRPIVWVQEEPENMGALGYMRLRFEKRLSEFWPFHCVSRQVSPSPATGSASLHKHEQAEIVARAFAPLT